MKQFLIALQFLTILPIKFKKEISNEDIAKSLAWFPFVGTVISFFLISVCLLEKFFLSSVISVLIILAAVIITGGLHLDGLADAFDGFYGQRSKEERLRIMKDSSVGAMGVTAIVLSVLLRFVLLESIPLLAMKQSLIFMVVGGRWVQVFSCFFTDYARHDGTAKSFMAHVGRREIVMATIFTVVIYVFLGMIKGFLIFLLLVGTAFLFLQFCKKKIGGMTGDTIGAANEIAEVSVLIFVNMLGNVYV